MPLVLRYAARSDVGRVRAKNDDSAYVGRHLAVLADGMGGHVGGDVASASTVLDLAPLDDVGYEDPATVLPDEIQNANLVLNELVHANPKLAGMGTTCTAALLAGTTLHMAHIGDSRAYRLKDGVFSQVTRDHTFVQKLVDEGRLSPEEAQHHPNKNVLMRVLGDVDASPELDVFEVPVVPGERWLLCSDGLTDVVPARRIQEVLAGAGALNEAVDTLVDLTLAGGAPDNVTIVVFEVAEGTPEELAPPPEVHLSEDALAAARPAERGPVSGRLLREDLAARPHVLVGAANSAVRTDRIPVVTRGATLRRSSTLLGESPVPENRPRRTAALLTAGPAAEGVSAPVSPAAPAPTAADDAGPGGTSVAAPIAPGSGAEERPPAEGRKAGVEPAPGGSAAGDAGAGRGRRRRDRPVEYRRGWFIPVFTALLALILGAVLLWGYLWTQTQYYVGEDQGRVAVFKGVPQTLGPVELSRVDRTTDVPLERLPAYAQDRVRQGMPARDLGHADQIVGELQETAGAPVDGGGTP
ncbi:PP2C family protein-serine/threonine phosphatase [Micrococcus lacusdianchii]|uniref:PP2C family protein-serine/threonine phosphatase n=1 Tax=Micrococcus lacusdianchii TaxID=2915940 RepID=UPI0020030205|nr:PP2C family serine/threonine-protein phosphatase [Micrococcus sp. JXJ CY 30]